MCDIGAKNFFEARLAADPGRRAGRFIVGPVAAHEHVRQTNPGIAGHPFTLAERMSWGVSSPHARTSASRTALTPEPAGMPGLSRVRHARSQHFHFSFVRVSPASRFAAFTFLDHTVLHGQMK
ncbi:hypothetical protein [Burkholderia cepacia]|uniref:hypothetical protein n=1 Tax=Burkholderia cepacia TaxID=292 RepID=UPI000A46791B|nr:hypothetical protein [Burkholderia cepacia]